jgi:hypothetical protein
MSDMFKNILLPKMGFLSIMIEVVYGWQKKRKEDCKKIV